MVRLQLPGSRTNGAEMHPKDVQYPTVYEFELIETTNPGSASPAPTRTCDGLRNPVSSQLSRSWTREVPCADLVTRRASAAESGASHDRDDRISATAPRGATGGSERWARSSHSSLPRLLTSDHARLEVPEASLLYPARASCAREADDAAPGAGSGDMDAAVHRRLGRQTCSPGTSAEWPRMGAGDRWWLQRGSGHPREPGLPRGTRPRSSCA